MKRSDSILQQFYMDKLPKAQEGLFNLIDRRPRYDQIPSPGRRLEEIKRMEAAKAAAPITAAAKKQREAQIIADRQARIKASIEARSKPFSAQQLADETQAIGDKFRIFPNDPDSFIDEYLNPGVFIGNMASQLGRVPLDVQRGNYGKAAMSVGVPLALGAAEAVVAPLLKRAGNYITTQTPVSNAYKLNPFAYKGSDAFYYRGVGKEGMEDALAKGYFRGKPNVQRVNFPGTNLNAAKSFGNTTYWSPKISTATEYGQGIIAEVPRDVAKFAQKYSKSPWSQFTNQRIGTDQARFLQKDWLRGYREIPTVYTDVRKMTPSNIGKYVDLSTDVSGGTGVHNLGVYPMKRDNRILFKVGFENKRNPIFEADYTPEDMVALTKNLDPRFFGKTYKSIGLSPKQAGLFKQAGNRNMQYFTGDRQNYDLTGNVISRVEGRNLEQLAAEDIADIPQSAYQRYIDDIVDLDNKGVAYDIFGDNFVYDPAVQRFKLFDLSSKSGASPIQFNPYGLTPSSSGNKTIMQLDKAKLRENLNQKLRGRFLNDINSDDKMGAYSDDDIVNMFNAIYDRIKNTKKTGGAIVDPRGQWAYPGMNTIVPTPTGQITMQGVPYPVYGQDETGYSQMMYPDGEYKFPGQMVYEIPMAQNGKQIGWWDSVAKDVKNLFGIKDEVPIKRTVSMPVPKTFKIKDNRKINATTGKPINPNKDLVSGSYDGGRIYEIIRAAKRYGIDPYYALAVDLQESSFGNIKDGAEYNIGHLKDNSYQEVPSLVIDGNYGSGSLDAQSADYFARTLVAKQKTADRLGIKDPAKRIQVYNGLGKVFPKTEKGYHGFEMKQIYGVPLPEKGIDLSKNPLYGKRIIDFMDNVLKKDENINNYVRWTKEKGGVVMMQRGGRIIKQREDFKPWWNWASKKAGDVDGRQDAFGTLGDLYAYYAGQPLHYNTLEYSQYKPSKAKNPNANYISINDPKFKQEVFDKYNDVFIKKELGKGKLQAQKINDSTYSVSGYTPATRKQFEEAKKLGTHPVYMKGKEYVSNAIGRYFISKGKDEKGDYISYYDTFDEGSGPDGGGIGEMLKLTKPFEIYDRIYLDPKTGKPKMQRGGQYVDSTLNTKTNLDFVKRLYDNSYGSIPTPRSIKGWKPGMRSTHLMAYDPGSRRVYPEIVNINGRLTYMPGDAAYDYADSTGEFIEFPTAIDAKWFSENYKKGKGVLPKNASGGQHGGLDRWFAEKWVDVKTGKTCGRQEGENRAYPACRPSKRVSSQTPKTSSEMSPAEKAKFKRSKTSSQRINYNHKRN